MTLQEFPIPDILAGWDMPRAAAPSALSFGVEEAAEEIPVWRTSLPADPAEAEAQLDQAEQQLRAVQAALETVPERVDALAARAAQGAAGVVSFGVETLPGADTELLDLLASAGAETGGVSFGVAGISVGNWQQAQEFFTTSLQRLSGAITRLALVETSVGGQAVGRTVINWSGDLDTAWLPPVLQERQSQHERSLRTALAARNLLLNMLIVTLQSAGKISAALAVPGGVVMALPAVWKYVNRIINEVEQFQKLNGGS